MYIINKRYLNVAYVSCINYEISVFTNDNYLLSHWVICALSFVGTNCF